MSRPDRAPDPHPVPTRREVVITALDRRHGRFVLETVLAARGIDVTLPYREEATDIPDAMLYVQDISQDTPSL